MEKWEPSYAVIRKKLTKTSLPTFIDKTNIQVDAKIWQEQISLSEIHEARLQQAP